jgi:alpha-L-arabinofuranosidase
MRKTMSDYESNLFQHRSDADATRAELAVDVSMHSDRPISPLLYGKFCEHLGGNIYNGMDAQIVRNPTFGSWPFGGGDAPDGGYVASLGVEEARKVLSHRLEAWCVQDVERLVEAYEDSGALLWHRIGPRERVRLSPDIGPNGCRAQRVEILGEGSSCGIGQWLYLPHRTRGYEFRVVARAAEPVEATLSLASAGAGAGPEIAAAPAKLSIGADWTVVTGRLTLPAGGADDGPWVLGLVAPTGANVVLARVLLRPDDHLDGADPDIIARLREAHLPLLRWPGGNFVSGYHWSDGVGPADLRPTRTNPAWACLETNLFGTDEFLAFCRNVGCEALICVNAGTGTPAEAAAWVEYCNGSPETPMGRRRAENGHPQPYSVRYWEVGNELYGRWQVHWTTPGGYADRYCRFAEAMRTADPSMRLLACGHGSGTDWDRTLIERAGKDLRCITHHVLMGGEVDEAVGGEDVFHAFLASPGGIVAGYRANAERMGAAGVEEPRVAVTELQMFAHRPHRPGQAQTAPIPTPATISEALYDALFLHEFIRAGDLVELFTHTGTVNHGGGLRKTRERVWANPAHYGHVLGVALAGATPVAVRLVCGTVSSRRAVGPLAPAEEMPVLDALAALSEDGASLLVMLVHRSATTGAVSLTLDLGDFPAAGSAEVVQLAGESFADENTPEEPERISPKQSTLPVTKGRAELVVPPFSLTRLRFSRAN